MAMTRLDIIWFYYFWMCVFGHGEIMCVGGSTISKFTKNKFISQTILVFSAATNCLGKFITTFCNSLNQKMQALSQYGWTND